ncbi:RNA polymerase sigma factor [Chitinophaga alhagiae]|uniref:RNA polymerase sigma factor n=1 Tax=Chitinophaga alhagiae TaxID=2203219 RepID=UPI0018E4DB22|nr:sigma-70 family RNA polymerase sigma factor [Chitinophaga alhagiae]
MLQHIYRAHFGKMVSALLYHSGISRMADAEDIVQEAFAAAAASWPQQLPEKPEAWLYATIRNIANKQLSRQKPLLPLDDAGGLPAPAAMQEDGDLQLLRLLFACMRPEFSPKLQLVMALRYVHGLQVQQVAALLGAAPDTVSKMLYRRQQLPKERDIAFSSGFVWWSEQKVLMALKVLYLVFTEGWKYADEQLCEDALSLTKTVIRQARVGVADARALFALMLLQLSRLDTRTSETGELLELEHQDRSRWNKDMILVASRYLHESAEARHKPFLLEATIAWLHAAAPSFAATPWAQIAALYRQLQHISPSPFVQLNHAIALHFAGQPDNALALLAPLEEHDFMQRHHLFHCSMARIFTDRQQPRRALEYYEKALRCKLTPQEEHFILKKKKQLLT